MHLGGHCYNRIGLLTSKGAEKSTVASAADCEVEADSLTAGHERKHNACRARGCVLYQKKIQCIYRPRIARHYSHHHKIKQEACTQLLLVDMFLRDLAGLGTLWDCEDRQCMAYSGSSHACQLQFVHSLICKNNQHL